MSFLERFTETQRQEFEATAESMPVVRGHYLLRRGEPGGDIYLLTQGNLEVVNTHIVPEVILAQIQVGSSVGELAFIDDSPRSADVRATVDSIVLRWSRDDLRNLLDRRQDLAAVFYAAVCRDASARIRRVTAGAVTGAFQRSEQISQEGLRRVQDETRAMAEHVKTRFLDVERLLRANPNDEDARRQVHTLLDTLQGQVCDVFRDHPEPEAGEIAADVLCRELHPYLVRSHLAERCIRRPQGITGTAEILAHVLVNTAGGDGHLGVELDRWLLDRPTLSSLRAFRSPTVDLVAEHLPTHRNRRVLLINAGTGSLVASLTQALSSAPTLLTVVDQSRDALAFLSAATHEPRSRGVEIVTVQENLAQFALGRARHDLPPQDAVIVHGLLEYMPERIAVSLVQVCRNYLHDDGALIASALGPANDAALLDRLLSWPTIRRPWGVLERVLESGGMQVLQRAELPEPGLLFCAGPCESPEA